MPSLSESDDTPANLRSEIAVESVMPFVIVPNPEIAALGVNVSSEMIAIRFPSLNHLVTFCETSVEVLAHALPLHHPVQLFLATSAMDF